MMGLYLVAVVATWLGVAVWIGVRLSRWNSTSNEKNKTSRKFLSIIVLLVWFGASFWFSGGRVFYYDWRVRQLCAIDGGVKVYETAPLTYDLIDSKTGRVNLKFKGYEKSEDKYYLETEDSIILRGNPEISRSKTMVIRRSDQKILGEEVLYRRGGGELPGPWPHTGYRCPEGFHSDLQDKIFIRSEK